MLNKSYKTIQSDAAINLDLTNFRYKSAIKSVGRCNADRQLIKKVSDVSSIFNA